MASSALPKILRDFRARELSKFLPPASSLSASASASASASLASSTLTAPASPAPQNNSNANANANATRLSNPFLPWLNPRTGRWAPPLYSRRRQKELVKAARAAVTGDVAGAGVCAGAGALGLLPPGPKCSAVDVERARDVWREAVKGAAWTGPTQPTPTPTTTTVAESAHTTVDVEWVGRLRAKDQAPHTSPVSRLYANKKRMFKGHKWERAMESRKRTIAVRMRDMKQRVERFKNHYRRRRPNPLRPAVSKKRESLPF